MNIVLAFAILFFVYFVGAQQVDQTVGEIRGGSPAAKVLQPGDRIVAVDGKRFAGLDREARLERFGKQVGSHECAGKQVEGCLAATPVALTIEPRRADAATISVSPEYDKAGEAGADRLLLRQRSRSTSAPATAVDRALDRSGWSPHGPASSSPTSSKTKQRKQISGIVGISDVANQTIDVGMTPGAAAARPGQPLARPDQPAADPAARRRPHLLGAGRESARRQAGLAAGDGAGDGGRLRPGRWCCSFIGLSNDIGRLTGEGFNVR